MPDLSIIIPIYNTPIADLQRCFDSMPKDDIFQIILIDDGSEASIGDFCKTYIRDYPSFSYYYKENGGVSSARNLGIQHAQGKYLTFVDADDIILEDTITQSLHIAGEPDMVFFDMLVTQNNKHTVWEAFPLPQGPLTQEQVLYQLCTNSSISGPVAKLYKTEMVRQANILFDPEFISGEDWMFVCDCVLCAQNFAYIKNNSYQYFHTPATGQSRMKRFPDKMLHNQVDRYSRKIQIIDQKNWAQYSPQRICELSAIELIENLFNSAATLLLLKSFTSARKSYICDAVTGAKTYLSDHTGKKTRIKLFVLLKCPIALWPLALMRQIYLRLK